MANVKLTFLGTERSNTDETELECFVNEFDEIYIHLEDNYGQFICLDKSTAIRFAKTLRTEINKIGS